MVLIGSFINTAMPILFLVVLILLLLQIIKIKKEKMVIPPNNKNLAKIMVVMIIIYIQFLIGAKALLHKMESFDAYCFANCIHT